MHGSAYSYEHGRRLNGQLVLRPGQSSMRMVGA